MSNQSCWVRLRPGEGSPVRSIPGKARKGSVPCTAQAHDPVRPGLGAHTVLVPLQDRESASVRAAACAARTQSMFWHRELENAHRIQPEPSIEPHCVLLSCRGTQYG